MLARPVRGAVAAALAIAALTALTACSALPTTGTTTTGAAASGGTAYYLALGDSLSQGVQPNASGASVETSQGYPELVYAQLRRTQANLQLVHLGCPGETTQTMMHGGICRYAGGSQLAAADAFLSAHRGQVSLVTLDIGANDPEVCGSVPSASCVGEVPGAAGRLTTILHSLRNAAGPGVRIVGMNYYLPVLAQWRNGPQGRLIAEAGERLAVPYNDSLDGAYALAGDSVANVFSAFSTTDFGDPVSVPGIGSLPRNVARVCQWTWECAPKPRGPNQHANPTGYSVIASAFLKVIGTK